MLTLHGRKFRNLCDGVPRRDFLTIGALGATGLTLADLLRARAQAAPAAPAQARPNKAVIMVYLNGGPSHIDTYDLKPNAPVEFRGEFKPNATSVPGLDICELLPRQAKIADKLAIVRNLRFLNNKDFHLPDELVTGFPSFVDFGDRETRPHFGSVVSRLRTDKANPMPPYVVLDWTRGANKFATDTAYLSSAHQPFQPRGPGLENLRLHPAVSLERLEDRKTLLRAFDGLRRDLDAANKGEAEDDFAAKSFEIIVSPEVREAFDITKEPAETRRLYGNLNCLLARRLVEAGVSVVSLTFSGGYQDWDTHEDNFGALRRSLPVFDQAIAGLVTDLHQRGLDKDVAVVIWGEMGRTPRVNNRSRGGRDHWPQAGFALLAGGGFRTGQAIGATTARAERPLESSYTPQNVLATLYRHLGIDPATTLRDRGGRPLPLLDDGEPITELT